MMKTTRVWSVTLLCVALSSTPANAWNSYGHMLVAAVAYEHLHPEARQQALALLQLNPDYAAWISGVPPQQQSLAAFLRAATWADEIKHQPGYVNDGERPKGPDVGANVGYADHLQHRYWHFVDFPFSQDGTRLDPPARPNAQTQIGVFRTALASRRTSADVKSYDLVWLLHLVGDIHQPLHAASRFTQAQPQGDNGGNRVSLCALPCRKELHAYWDDILGSGKSPASALRRASTLPPAEPSAVAIRDETVWAKESLALAESAVYVPPVGGGAGPYILDADYRSRAKQVASAQVELAGERLAALLNTALAAQ
jgi:hypothetical protein